MKPNHFTSNIFWSRVVADLLQEINAYSFRCVEHYSLFDDHAASVVNIHFTRPKKMYCFQPSVEIHITNTVFF